MKTQRMKSARRNRSHNESLSRQSSVDQAKAARAKAAIKAAKSKSPKSVYSSRRFRAAIDLETPKSLLVNIRLKSIINVDTFNLLQEKQRQELIHLLPSCDQRKNRSGMSIIHPEALTNEFFGKACVEWCQRLSEGEFMKDRQQMDALWKVRHLDGPVSSKTRLLESLPPVNRSGRRSVEKNKTSALDASPSSPSLLNLRRLSLGLRAQRLSPHTTNISERLKYDRIDRNDLPHQVTQISSTGHVNKILHDDAASCVSETSIESSASLRDKYLDAQSSAMDSSDDCNWKRDIHLATTSNNNLSNRWLYNRHMSCSEEIVHISSSGRRVRAPRGKSLPFLRHLYQPTNSPDTIKSQGVAATPVARTVYPALIDHDYALPPKEFNSVWTVPSVRLPRNPKGRRRKMRGQRRLAKPQETDPTGHFQQVSNNNLISHSHKNFCSTELSTVTSSADTAVSIKRTGAVSANGFKIDKTSNEFLLHNCLSPTDVPGESVKCKPNGIYSCRDRTLGEETSISLMDHHLASDSSKSMTPVCSKPPLLSNEPETVAAALGQIPGHDISDSVAENSRHIVKEKEQYSTTVRSPLDSSQIEADQVASDVTVMSDNRTASYSTCCSKKTLSSSDFASVHKEQLGLPSETFGGSMSVQNKKPKLCIKVLTIQKLDPVQTLSVMQVNQGLHTSTSNNYDASCCLKGSALPDRVIQEVERFVLSGGSSPCTGVCRSDASKRLVECSTNCNSKRLLQHEDDLAIQKSPAEMFGESIRLPTECVLDKRKPDFTASIQCRTKGDAEVPEDCIWEAIVHQNAVHNA